MSRSATAGASALLGALLCVFLGGLLLPAAALAESSITSVAAGSATAAPAAEQRLMPVSSSDGVVNGADITELNTPLLFEQSCAACHVGGGNVIRRGKNLKAKALKRYGMDSHEAIANIITNGKGIMSAYGEAAENGAPTRLTAAEIDALADYVLAQAATDWK